MTRRNTRKWGFLVLLAVLLLGCQEEPMEPTELIAEDRVLDCPLTITLMEMEGDENGGFPSQLPQEAINRMMAIGEELESENPDSIVGQLNASAGIGGVEVFPEIRWMFEEAVMLSVATEGRFDITIGPVTDLWKAAMEENRDPNPADLKKAQKLVEYGHLIFDGNEVSLRTKGMRLDLGSMSRGIMMDEASRHLIQNGSVHGVLTWGQDVLYWNTQSSITTHRAVGLNPTSGEPLFQVELQNQAMVVEGVANLTGNGGIPIVEPHTGELSETDVALVWVIAPTAVEADGVSTAAYLMGVAEGLSFVEKMEGVELIYWTKEGQWFTTQGLQGKVDFL
jgi:thiamine biosynthesis lipoprotein